MNRCKLGLMIILLLVLSSCGTNEFYDDFCAISEEETIYIDEGGRFSTFIKNLEDDKNISFLDHNWKYILYQNQDFRELFELYEWHDLLRVDYSELIKDIEENSVEDPNTGVLVLDNYEFDSRLVINFRDGFKNCSKEFKVHYYDLNSEYADLYQGVGTLYNFSIEQDGYYEISRTDNDKIRRYIAHFSDIDYVDDLYRIAVEEKYLGFDFIVYQGLEIVAKTHLQNLSYYYYNTNSFLHTDEDNIIWDSYGLGDISMWFGLQNSNTRQVDIFYKVDDEIFSLSKVLIENETYMDNTVDDVDVEYSLITYDVFEIKVLYQDGTVSCRIKLD